MKYNQELINWFNDYFNNCYYAKHEDYPETIFMFYDINYVRQLKLAKLEGIDYVEKTEVTGICLFEQDWKHKWILCNYDLIWKYLQDNYSPKYKYVQSFINNMLKEHSKLSILTPLSKNYTFNALTLKFISECICKWDTGVNSKPIET